jgi:hypothetical protein
MKIDSTTILIGLAAVVVVYMVTRPKPVAPVPMYNPGYNPYATGYNQPQSTTAQDIAAGGQAASGLGDLISNLFG